MDSTVYTNGFYTFNVIYDKNDMVELQVKYRNKLMCGVTFFKDIKRFKIWGRKATPSLTKALCNTFIDDNESRADAFHWCVPLDAFGKDDPKWVNPFC